MVIITPVLKRLKELGYEVVVHTGWRGKLVLKNSPNVDRFIDHDKETPISKFHDYVEEIRKKEKPDKFISFTESIEANVALHPIGPRYIFPKQERYETCNRNYYDVTTEWAKVDGCEKIPSLYFSEEEEETAKKILEKGKFNILWSLSGSGRQKVYPWAEYVMGECLRQFKDIHIITVGDETCQLLETLQVREITNLSGKINIRTSMCLTKFVNLVISPDTGILHASGCYSTPKIGLLGHTTIDNITRHFINDYSIEAHCACAPCFLLIYDHNIQCPIEPVTGAAWCQAEGIKPEVVFDRIRQVRHEYPNTP